MQRPKLVREWVGLLCALTREIHNGYGSIAVGSKVVVTSTHRGKVNIRVLDRCECCGVQWSCGAVSLSNLRPLERVAPAEPARKRSI